jgi:signal transduction histidine kinase
LSLRTLIFSTVFGLALLPLLTLVAFNLPGHIARHEEDAHLANLARARIDFAELTGQLERLRQTLQQVASLPAVEAMVSGRSEAGDAGLAELLAGWFVDDLRVEGLTLFDAGGVPVFRLGRNARQNLQLQEPEAPAAAPMLALDRPPVPGSRPAAGLLWGRYAGNRGADFCFYFAAPVAGGKGKAYGLAILQIDPEALLHGYMDAWWIAADGRSLFRQPSLSTVNAETARARNSDFNFFATQPGLQAAMFGSQNQPFIWDVDKRQHRAWLPLALSPGEPPQLWLGKPVSPAADGWKRSLVLSIVWVVLLMVVVVFFIANRMTADVERIKEDMLTGLDCILNEEKEVRFQWRGPEELQTLARELNALAHRYAATSEARRKAEGALRESERMASLGLLVSGVAHEINNPNSIIMLNTPMLHRAWESVRPILEAYHREHGDFMVAGLEYSEMREQVPILFDESEESARRIRRIVSDLREYARQDTTSELEVVDLNEIVQTAVRLTGNRIRKSTNHFIARYEPSLPAVRGSRHRLEQVIINLIHNACESLPDSGAAITLATAHNPGKQMVEVRVEDQGAGIPPEVLGQITDPFFTTKRNLGGTGLGLSVSAGIVKDHQGSMQFDSEPGRGTTATVSFPVLLQSGGGASSV